MTSLLRFKGPKSKSGFSQALGGGWGQSGLTELRGVKAEKGKGCIVKMSLIAGSGHDQFHRDVTFHITTPRNLSINGETMVQQKP